ncbi:hypothetical protein [Pseudomonas sp. TE3610]
MLSTEHPILGMAQGNLGAGLIRYSSALYDAGHTFWFFVHGRRHLESAIEGGGGRDGATFSGAIDLFRGFQAWVAERVDDDSQLFYQSLGTSKVEEHYRQRCLDAQLFLNPMNDLGALPVACYDVLRLPDHNAEVGITYLGSV